MELNIKSYNAICNKKTDNYLNKNRWKITGIKYEVAPSLKGKVVKVEIDGQKYEATIN